MTTPQINIITDATVPLNFITRSLSYVTTLACFAFVLLVLVYYAVDVKKWWSGAPFYYPGEHSFSGCGERTVDSAEKWLVHCDFCFTLTCTPVLRYELHPRVRWP